MTIDKKLIDQATQYSINQINQLPAAPLILLTNFLHTDLFRKLQRFIEEESIQWLEEQSSGKRREKIHWLPDSVIEESHTVMENLTESLNHLYNRNNKFHGITIWKDSEHYTIGKHFDNPIINLAIQIYLTGGMSGLGTRFILHNSEIQANYKENNGYLMDNTARIPHYLSSRVPADHIRYSFYAIWTDAETSINTTNSE